MWLSGRQSPRDNRQYKRIGLVPDADIYSGPSIYIQIYKKTTAVTNSQNVVFHFNVVGGRKKYWQSFKFKAINRWLISAAVGIPKRVFPDKAQIKLMCVTRLRWHQRRGVKFSVAGPLIGHGWVGEVGNVRSDSNGTDYNNNFSAWQKQTKVILKISILCHKL